MNPTPRRMPTLTAALLLGGLGVLIAKSLLPVAADKALLGIGALLFFAGLVVALVGAIWSIGALANPAARTSHGITTPVVTILIAALAWGGAGLTIRSLTRARHAQVEPDFPSPAPVSLAVE